MNSLENKKILVVDDEIQLNELLVDLFLESGFEVKSAASAEEAIKILKDFNPFLVISDINMPKVNGIELLEKIKLFTPPIPEVILCTGFDGYDTEHIKNLGALDLIRKPYRFEDLLQNVCNLVEKKSVL